MGPWCRVCCTRHAPDRLCPRERELTGVEFVGFKVNVETPQGMRAIGVLLGEAGRGWRARIITHPNVLWTVPGGGGTNDTTFCGRSTGRVSSIRLRASVVTANSAASTTLPVILQRFVIQAL